MKRPIVITLLVSALALVCLGIGAVIFFGINAGFPVSNLFDVPSIAASLEESKTLKIDAEKPVTLKVIDHAGAVIINGEDVETVQVRVVKTAFAASQVGADEEVNSIEYTIEQTGNAITLRYELPRSMSIRDDVNTVDFFVTVPTTTAVTVDSNFGGVSVTAIVGNTDIVNDFGDVTAEDLEGALSVDTNSGEITASSIQAGQEPIELHSDFGAVTLRNASGGDVTVDSNSGKITLQDVRATGDMTAATDFGDTSFENGSGASLSVETNSGKVTLVKVRIREQIKVQNDFGEIELDQALAASYDLHTNSGSITVNGAEGKLKAHTDFGGIKLENARDVSLDLRTNSGTVEFNGSLGAGPHLVSSDFGDIDLTLPGDAQLDVDLSTDFGTIGSDLPITVTVTGSSNPEDNQIVGSINGGGGKLTAHTNSGSVRIHVSQ